MNSRQIRDLIRISAQDVEVPEKLRPEQIERMLKGKGSLREKVAQEKAQGKCRESAEKAQKKRGKKFLYAGCASAAALLVAVCGAALLRMDKGQEALQDSGSGQNILRDFAQAESQIEAEDALTEGGAGGTGAKTYGIKEEAPEEKQEAPEEKQKKVREPKKDAGALYVVADSYGQVYDTIEAAPCYVICEASATDEDGVVGAAEIPAMTNKEAMAAGEEVLPDYSQTNVQTEGVGESDFVKTDGSYLYAVAGNSVHIVDISEGTMLEKADVTLPEATAFLTVEEIYVERGKLLVIAEKKETELKKEVSYYRGEQEGDVSGEQKKEVQYRMCTSDKTVLYTYSLEDASGPDLLDSVEQDGSYYTSRMIGDKVYMFTRDNLWEDCYASDRYSYEWVPLAGGRMIPADSIYLPKSGGSGLIVSSVDVDAPGSVLDSVMVVNDSVNVYVSTEAFYLYGNGADQTTEVARFDLKDGVIDASGATSVKGRVQDTFAVSEHEKMFRILTRSGFSEDGTNLYILDESLQLRGKLEGIAPGETVYAARYLGDMAYFVTYRNVDPLFAADLSDPENPKLLGELKITGYSEYLHMWKDDTMFGLGLETDENTGRTKGVKLTMFDVSDPVNLKVIDNLCISNAVTSSAFEQYKAVLADAKTGLIGFPVTGYGENRLKDTYLLFEWKDGKFSSLLAQDISAEADYSRGVYAGDCFYVVTQKGVAAYDRTDGYKKAGELTF